MSVNIPNFLCKSCLPVFAFSQLKNTNIFKEVEVSEEGVPERQAPVTRRRTIPPSKGTSEKKVSLLSL